MPAKQQREKESLMNKVESEKDDDLQPEYDFSQMEGGVRGKYVERYRQGTNLVLLDIRTWQLPFPTLRQ